jgi:polysaccharide biosynthesis protein PslH
MKVLQLCSKSPYPPHEGGPIAMNNISQGLIEKGHHVKVFAVSTKKYPISLDKIPSEYISKTDFEFEFIDTSINAFDAFINLFSKKSYNISRFYSKVFENRLIEILKKDTYDIIQFESIYLAPYLPVVRQNSKARCVLRSHNIEHFIWKRLAEGTINPLKKLYLSYLTIKLKRYELSILNKFDAIVAITEIDAEFLKSAGAKIPIESIPVGIPKQQVIYRKPEFREFPGIFHLGSMDWLPNQQGIRWLITEVWPKVIKKHPDLTLHLAGRNMPQWLINFGSANIIIDGEVKNAIDYMSSKSIMVVPLLSGSGIRVKIIEGMACGNTVITTPTGAEGIECTNGNNILIANSAVEFSEKISLCINNRDLCNKISENAIHLIRIKYNNVVITEKLITFYRILLLNKSRIL